MQARRSASPETTAVVPRGVGGGRRRDDHRRTRRRPPRALESRRVGVSGDGRRHERRRQECRPRFHSPLDAVGIVAVWLARRGRHRVDGPDRAWGVRSRNVAVLAALLCATAFHTERDAISSSRPRDFFCKNIVKDEKNVRPCRAQKRRAARFLPRPPRRLRDRAFSPRLDGRARARRRQRLHRLHRQRSRARPQRGAARRRGDGHSETSPTNARSCRRELARRIISG